MTIADLVKANVQQWQFVPPGAGEAAIQAMLAATDVRLPSEYADYLRTTNGGEGDLAAEPGWFQMWSAENVVELNKSYEVQKFLPGFFGIGSNGGDELLAFDMRPSRSWPIVMVPFIPMHAAKARPVAPDFVSFVRLMGLSLDT